MDTPDRVGPLMAGRTFSVTVGDQTRSVTVDDGGATTVEGGSPASVEPTRAPGEFVVRRGDAQQRLFVVAERDTTWIFHDGAVFECMVEPAGSARRRTVHHHGSLAAPMPATVIAVHVKPGDAVTRGQTVILLEAMKMELPLKAPGDGIVAAVHCQPGELVQPNVSLVDLE